SMTEGPFFRKIVLFAVPVTLTGLLQIVYNTADTAVVGRFAGKAALAAVGSTGSMISLIVNLFTGLSMGAGVLTARMLGAKNADGVRRAVHTAMGLSVLCGCVIAAVGIAFSPTLLRWMQAPEDTIGLSALYVRLYFLGAPGSMVFNFGAAIIRSTGDTGRPLRYLAASGLVNILLNLFTIIVLRWGVAGVAVATVSAQYLTAFLAVRRLTATEDAVRLTLRDVRFYREELREILRIGFPAGVQNALFSVSNVIIQSNVNTFGSDAMAGISAGSNFDAYIYTATNGYTQAAMTFISQNVGAGKKENIRRLWLISLGSAAGAAAILQTLGFLLRFRIVGLFSSDAAVIAVGAERMALIMPFYIFCSLLDVTGGAVRGLGRSFQIMLVSLFGACGLRLLWVFFFLPLNRTLRFLYVAYPLSWGVTFAVAAGLFLWLTGERRLTRILREKAPAAVE
ncbi:MAG: MATE family efflux transporter, partial [Clostridia bacterium]|nr:MATE family efflux transporter [Clostridia bacterium]